MPEHYKVIAIGPQREKEIYSAFTLYAACQDAHAIKKSHNLRTVVIELPGGHRLSMRDQEDLLARQQ